MALIERRNAAVFVLALSACALQGMPLSADAKTFFSGRVTDTQNHPIAGVTVEAGFFNNAGILSKFVVDGQASTNAQGIYAITALDSANTSGQYVLVAEAIGYVAGIYPSLNCVDPNCINSSGLPTYSSGTTANFVLQKGGSISGNVSRTDSKEPVAGALISLQPQTAGDYVYGGIASATADSLGHYQFPNLPVGNYTLSVQPPISSPLLTQVYANHDVDATLNVSGDIVTLSEGQAVSAINFPLDPGVTFSGSLTSAINGAPVYSIVSVSRIGANAVPGYVQVGSGTGQYQSGFLAPGSFDVQFGPSDAFSPLYYSQAATPAQAQIVVLPAGQNVSGIDAQLTPTQTIAGTVSDSVTHQPIQGAHLHAGYNIAFQFLDLSDAISDASGNFLLQGLDTGSPSYYVWVDEAQGYVSEFYPSVTPCCDGAPTGAVTYTLSSNEQLTGVDFALQKGAYASGRIYDSLTNGNIPGLQVQLYDSGGNQVAVTASGAPDSPPSDTQGNYYTAAVTVGQYYIGINTNLGTVLYPSVVCPSTGCVFAQAQLVNFSAAQDYPGFDFAVPNLDLIFRGNFDQ